jgi:hypothetical protein
MCRLGLVSLLFLIPVNVRAAESVRYAEGKHGPAELRYINELPVLTVAGTPDEMGAQIAALTTKSAKRLLSYPQEILRSVHLGFLLPQLINMSNGMIPQFPADHLKELDAMVKQSGFDRNLAILGNTLPDLLKIAACATLIVEPPRSATGGPLFGRNLDYPTLGFLNEYSLVTVYRPKDKHAFVSIGFPGMVGCLSGMNDAGLAIATLEVYRSKDGASRLDPKGVPYTLTYRRVLEECSTVAEAEQLLRSLKRTTMNNLAVCDKKGGVVFEITSKSLVVRRPVHELCACTNHFRTPELATATPDQLSTARNCYRYPRLVDSPLDLEAGPAKLPKLDFADIARKLHEVNQGDETLQTMLFEPATLTLHLAIGKTPTSALNMKRLELAPLFKTD